MEKLDLKDRKILYHLDIDSRQSFGQLGKKVGLHKDVVAYRVKRLQEKGIIKNFITYIDEYKLGYAHLRIYISYQFVTPEMKKEIIDYFVKYKYTRFVHSNEGDHDLCLIMAVKDIPEFYKIWEDVLGKYRDYFAQQSFSVFFKQKDYRWTFLLEEKVAHKSKFEVYGSGKREEIDDLDFEILKIIALNSRTATIDIAKKLNSTPNTIVSRIKRLIKIDVINNFGITVDYSKLGYYFYKADIVLKDHKKIHEIINYIESNPNLRMIQKCIGYVDIELLFILKNVNQLHQIMEDLSNKFPDSIKNYVYSSTIQSHKWICMPEK